MGNIWTFTYGAVGEGLAMVGLDVRYGNRLFIHSDENGYLVDFDIETDFQNKDTMGERAAAAIVKIFEDDNRLKKFHENSYMIAEEYNHNCYLVMVTMNTLPEQLADIEEIEKALDCMEQSIRSKIRKVDVCTRYSSMQYLIILFEPQENQIPNVMERIFMHYYELCDRENFKPQYEYIKMTEVK